MTPIAKKVAEPYIRMGACPAVENASTNIAINSSGLSTEPDPTGEAIGLDWEKILDGWETDRTYWYMNYYQDCNQPEIKSGNVRVFDTTQELKEAIGKMRFRCPACGKETPDPYECKACGWKVYGFLGDMGKGVFVYVKEKLKGETIFMPISWEADHT